MTLPTYRYPRYRHFPCFILPAVFKRHGDTAPPTPPGNITDLPTTLPGAYDSATTYRAMASVPAYRAEERRSTINATPRHACCRHHHCHHACAYPFRCVWTPQTRLLGAVGLCALPADMLKTFLCNSVNEQPPPHNKNLFTSPAGPPIHPPYRLCPSPRQFGSACALPYSNLPSHSPAARIHNLPLPLAGPLRFFPQDARGGDHSVNSLALPGWDAYNWAGGRTVEH